MLLFVLLADGLPIGFAMGLSAFLGTLLSIDTQAALALLGQTAYETALTYNLSVVPMFVLMGYIAGEARLGPALYRACNAWLGHRRGGLALATIGGLRRLRGDLRIKPGNRGDDGADRAARMRRYGYDDRLAGGSLPRRNDRHPDPTGRADGDLRHLTETGIWQLFLAGLLPGILTVRLHAAIAVMTRRSRPARRAAGPRSRPRRGGAQRVGGRGTFYIGLRRTLYWRVLADRGRQHRRRRRARARPPQPQPHRRLLGARCSTR